MKSWAFSAVMVLSLLSGGQILAAPSEKTDVTVSTAISTTHSNATQIIENPKTTQELFQNLKLVLASRAMLDDEFYTDENLMRVFGGQSVFRDKVPNKTKLYVEGFGNMVPMMGDESFRYPGMSVFVYRGLDSGENNEFVSSIDIDVRFDDPQLNLVRLETLFGQDWKQLPPNQMHDNDFMRQIIIMKSRTQEGSIHRLASFNFNSEGYLRRAIFSIYDSARGK